MLKGIHLTVSILLSRCALSAPIPATSSSNINIRDSIPTDVIALIEHVCAESMTLQCILQVQMQAVNIMGNSSKVIMEQLQANSAQAQKLSYQRNELQEKLYSTNDPKEREELRKQISDIDSQLTQLNNMSAQLNAKIQQITNNYSNMSNLISSFMKGMKNVTNSIIQNIN